MKTSTVTRLSTWVAAVLLLVGSVLPAKAQTTSPPFLPLEITNIGPIGVRGLDGNNRIFRAYPGLVYNIRVAAIGGVYPFTYTLANAPSGMTIDANTGEINWPNPQTSAADIRVTVQDRIGAIDTETWSINVTTNGFRFVDAVNGRLAANNGCASSCGTGSFTNPWRTLGDLALNDDPTIITYFKSGTYLVTDISSMFKEGVGSVWERYTFNEDPRSQFAGSVIWIAYPGQNPIIDFGYRAATGAPGALLRHMGHSVYMDGFETINNRIIGFQWGPDANYRGGTYRKLRMHAGGPGGDGSNASFIMTLTTTPVTSYGMVVQNSAFYDVNIAAVDDMVALKFYSQSKLLVEDTTQYNMWKATELKADVEFYTVRHNTFFNLRATAIGGNMHGCVRCAADGSDIARTGGEISFNNARSADMALDLNQDGMAVRTYVHRNTLVGRVMVRNTDSADGPFYLSRNVIVSSDAGTPAGSHIYQYNVTDPSRIVLSENLVGYPSDNIVDASGFLTAGFSQWVGTRGFQTTTSTGAAPAAPTNLRIVTQ